MHKNIRQVVLQHEPEDIQQVKKWAIIAESSGSETDNSDIMGIIQRMEKKLDGMKVNEVGPSSYRRSGSPRVTFDENKRGRSQSPQRTSIQTSGDQWSRGDHDDYGTRMEYQGRGRDVTYRGSRGRSQGGWYNNSRLPSGGQNQEVSRIPQSQTSQSAERCPRCGYSHTPYQQFAAMGRICNNCGKINHFWSCCKQARGEASQQH